MAKSSKMTKKKWQLEVEDKYYGGGDVIITEGQREGRCVGGSMRNSIKPKTCPNPKRD